MSEAANSENVNPGETRSSSQDEARTTDGESLLWSASAVRGEIGLRRGPSGILPGAMCGRYLIVSRLGVGGMGEVYRAYDLSLGRSVAIKVLRSADENCAAHEQEERATRMVEEAQILARLAHENIVPVYEIGKIQNEIYVAMECLEGESMDEWIKKRRPPLIERLEALRQIALALGAAHEAGVIHRDIKPQNVMVCASHRVYVLDFGLAQRMQTHARGARSDRENHFGSRDQGEATDWESSVIGAGTPAYMSPEQYVQVNVDTRTDIYSFCVTMYEVLCGRRPIRANDLFELRRRVIRGQRSDALWPREIPRRLRGILDRGMTLRVEDRLVSMQPIVAALDDEIRRYRRRWSARMSLFVSVFVVGGWISALQDMGKNAVRCESGGARIGEVWADFGVLSKIQSIPVKLTEKEQGDWSRMQGRVNDWMQRWQAAAIENCEKTRKHHAQSDALMDWKSHCLDVQASQVSGLVHTISPNGRELQPRWEELIAKLPNIDACRSLRAVPEERSLPQRKWSEKTALGYQRLEEIVLSVFLAENKSAAQKCEQILKWLPEAEDPWLKIDVGLRCAMVLGDTPQVQRAAELARQTLLRAVAVNDAAGVLRACASLLYLYSDRLGDPGFALQEYLPLGVASLERSDLKSTPAYRQFLGAASIAFAQIGEYDDAIRLSRKFVEACLAVYGPGHITTIIAESNLGQAYFSAYPRRLDLAKEYHLRALQHMQRMNGLFQMMDAVSRSGLFDIARLTGDVQIAELAAWPRPLENISGEVLPGDLGYLMDSWNKYDRHRGNWQDIQNRTNAYENWLNAHWPDAVAGPDGALIIVWKIHTALASAQHTEAVRQYEGMLSRGYHRDLSYPRARVTAGLAQSCSGDARRAWDWTKEMTLDDFARAGVEAELAWEYWAMFGAIAVAHGEVDFAGQQLAQFKGARVRAQSDPEARFGWIRSLLYWSEIAAYLGQSEDSLQWLSDAKQILTHHFEHPDPQWDEYGVVCRNVYEQLRDTNVGLRCMYPGHVESSSSVGDEALEDLRDIAAPQEYEDGFTDSSTTSDRPLCRSLTFP